MKTWLTAKKGEYFQKTDAKIRELRRSNLSDKKGNKRHKEK